MAKMNSLDDLLVHELRDIYNAEKQLTSALPRMAKAAEAYTKALEITGGDSPADWRYYYVRGIAYERAKQWPKAEADFLKALELTRDGDTMRFRLVKRRAA